MDYIKVSYLISTEFYNFKRHNFMEPRSTAESNIIFHSVYNDKKIVLTTDIDTSLNT